MRIMEDNITIVSAYFDIGRENWGGFARDSDEYFGYFKSWAKIKNKLIVYVGSEDVKMKILNFRSSIGLAEETLVIVIDYQSIDLDLLEKMKYTVDNPYYLRYRLYPTYPEAWSAEYCYVVLLKFWFVKDAIERELAKGQIAWVDFGYNHGGEIIDPKSDFNYLWNYQFSNKINLFAVHELDNRPIFDIVFSLGTYIMAFMMVGPDELWPKLWGYIRNLACELLDCGLIDDEQTVLIMAVRKYPELFEIHNSKWFLPLKQYGGEHLELVRKSESTIISRIKKMYHAYKRFCRCFCYSMGIFRHLYTIRPK